MPTVVDVIEAVRQALGGRAAGLWKREEGRLILSAFTPAPDLPDEVGRAFAEATRSVGLDRDDLGIVQAATRGEPVVAVSDELPVEAGSGLWLRRFGAVCSIAVPVPAEPGRAGWVISIALGRLPADRREVIDALRREVAGLGGPATARGEV